MPATLAECGHPSIAPRKGFCAVCRLRRQEGARIRRIESTLSPVSRIGGHEPRPASPPQPPPPQLTTHEEPGLLDGKLEDLRHRDAPPQEATSARREKDRGRRTLESPSAPAVELPEPHVSLERAAKVLGRERRSMYKILARGRGKELRAKKVLGRYLVPVSALWTLLGENGGPP